MGDADEREPGDGVRKRTPGGEATPCAIAEERESLAKTVVVRNENPFFFWLWFMSVISAVMVVFVLGTSVVNRGESIEALAMPAGVREHFEAGKMVKVEVGRDRRPVKVFVRASGEGRVGDETVLLLHGLGASSFLYRKVITLLAAREVCAVAVDLPGAGLAEKFYVGGEAGDEEDNNQERGFFRVRFDALKEMLVEGFFRRKADESSEHEFLAKLRSSTKQTKGKKVLALGSDELGDAVDQVVASLELAPVHLVLHDTGVEVGLAWALQNPTKVASVTLVDSVPRLPSLPFWLFRMPLLGSVIAHSGFALRYTTVRICTLCYRIRAMSAMTVKGNFMMPGS